MGAGTAFFCLAKTSPESAPAFARLAREGGWTVLPLGAGTNLIGSDESLGRTVFLRISAGIRDEGGGVFLAEAGCPLPTLLQAALRSGFGGAAALSGIPGSVGGAIRMNAGACGKEISDFLTELLLLDLETGETRLEPKDSFQWGYRSASLPLRSMVLSARFRFPPADIEKERAAMEAERIRRARSPKGRSAGSVFRNPSPELPAGRILERAGVKGLRRGAFEVAQEHANWIVNRADGPAPARDCLNLIAAMRRAAWDATNILLQPETRIVTMNANQTMPEDASTPRPLNILLLKGGTSAEREVSLLSAANVANALREAGHHVEEYDIQKLEVTDAMRRADVVFPVLHGGFGEDGRIQELLEKEGIPFVGPSSQACRLIMDKFSSKQIMNRVGVLNPAYAVVDDLRAPVPPHLKLPLIVKPNSEGSTFGLSLVESPEEWIPALRKALDYGRTVLVEEYVRGTEATIGILLGQALPMIEIRYPGKLYDYDAKYTHAHGETQYLCPPQSIPEDVQKKAAEAALAYARAVGNDILVRVDCIIREGDNAVYMLEGNALPGFTKSSLLPQAAAVAGMSAPEVCSRLAYSALKGR